MSAYAADMHGLMEVQSEKCPLLTSGLQLRSDSRAYIPALSTERLGVSYAGMEFCKQDGQFRGRSYLLVTLVSEGVDSMR